jgi:hypothetical protein
MSWARPLWIKELLPTLHQLPDSHWDEMGLDQGLTPKKLGRGELLRLLHLKHVRTRTVWKRIGGRRVSDRGIYFRDCERPWRELFGDTPTQSSKIISLPRHSQRHSGDTSDDMEEEIA